MGSLCERTGDSAGGMRRLKSNSPLADDATSADDVTSLPARFVFASFVLELRRMNRANKLLLSRRTGCGCVATPDDVIVSSASTPLDALFLSFLIELVVELLRVFLSFFSTDSQLRAEPLSPTLQLLNVPESRKSSELKSSKSNGFSVFAAGFLLASSFARSVWREGELDFSFRASLVADEMDATEFWRLKPDIGMYESPLESPLLLTARQMYDIFKHLVHHVVSGLQLNLYYPRMCNPSN